MAAADGDAVKMRIGRALSLLGHCSRREGERLVAEGRVAVNGRQVTRPATLIDLSADAVTVDGRLLEPREGFVYVALYKPRGVVSTVRDPHAARTVVELVPSSARLYPVGRLDKDSEGLILLTNDGSLANLVTHPRYQVEKEYFALVPQAPSLHALARLAGGIPLVGHPSSPVRVSLASRVPSLESTRNPRPATRDPQPETRNPTRNPRPETRDPPGTWVRLVLREGRKREVRRMLAAVGCPTLRLIRTRIGPVRLGELGPGGYRALTELEVRALGGDQGPGARGQQAQKPQPPTPNPQPPFVVAIDGPSAVGKTTVGTSVAKQLAARFLDTGLLYRALTLLAIEEGIPPDDGGRLAAAAARLEVRARPPGRGRLPETKVLIGRRDVTPALHSGQLDRHVSTVASHPEVRSALIPLQRRLAAEGPLVAVGRDIGTVIFPEAPVKIFLEASAGERARRRAGQFEPRDPKTAQAEPVEAPRPSTGSGRAVQSVQRALEHRDTQDSTRPVAPLACAPDAIVIDTDSMPAEEVVDRICQTVRQRGIGRG